MGKVIQFPIKSKLDTDEFENIIKNSNNSDVLKEQLEIEVLPYIHKYSKLMSSDMKLELPATVSEQDEKFIVSQVQNLIQKQIENVQLTMLIDLMKVGKKLCKEKVEHKNT